MSLLDVQGVTMRFGGLVAVSDFNLKLKQGELCGLIGPNGAGKTTVFNMLTGVYRPTAGAISLEGESIVGLKPFEISHQGISRTFQNIRLFKEMSVLANVMVAGHQHTTYGLASALLRTKKFHEEEAALKKEALEP
jgi:branched-chain amino acid transport system ATP-binding protein